jgi:hypothetical protein
MARDGLVFHPPLQLHVPAPEEMDDFELLVSCCY